MRFFSRLPRLRLLRLRGLRERSVGGAREDGARRRELQRRGAARRSLLSAEGELFFERRQAARQACGEKAGAREVRGDDRIHLREDVVGAREIVFLEAEGDLDALVGHPSESKRLLESVKGAHRVALRTPRMPAGTRAASIELGRRSAMSSPPVPKAANRSAPTSVSIARSSVTASGGAIALVRRVRRCRCGGRRARRRCA